MGAHLMKILILQWLHGLYKTQTADQGEIQAEGKMQTADSR